MGAGYHNRMGVIMRYVELNGGQIYDSWHGRVCYLVPIQTMATEVAAGYMAQIMKLLNEEVVH